MAYKTIDFEKEDPRDEDDIINEIESIVGKENSLLIRDLLEELHYAGWCCGYDDGVES
jgi:hypothetical protein